MSYDLAVWIGDFPPDRAAAASEYDARLRTAGTQPPSPQIRAFVVALLERFPEGLDDGVWAAEPVLDDASGDFLCLTMTLSDDLDDVVDLVGDLAHERGLVAYDPQVERVLVGGWEQAQPDPWSLLTKHSAADLPEHVDLAAAESFLEVDQERLEELRTFLAPSQDLDIPLLMALILLEGHDEESGLDKDGWRSLLGLLRDWWVSEPDLVHGQDFLSTDGHTSRLTAGLDETPGWKPPLFGT